MGRVNRRIAGQSGRSDSNTIVFVGALHVDLLVWPIGKLSMQASNPVRCERRVGGVGANAARAAVATSAVLGRKGDIALIAAIGDDDDAGWLEKTLRNAGIQCLSRRVAGAESGTYTTVHDNEGDLLIGLSDTAIAERLSADTVVDAIEPLHPSALVLDANLSSECLAGLLATTGDPAADAATGEERPVRIALAVSPAKVVRFAPHLSILDLLICNRREAAALCGIDDQLPLDTLADALRDKGVSRFVLSDGAGPIIVHKPTKRTRVVVPPLRIAGSVNGAGDALAGAMIAAWLVHGNLVDAVRDAGLPAARAIIAP